MIATGSQISYRRSPLVSARDEQDIQSGQLVRNEPVVAVGLSAKDMEALDLVETLRERKRSSGAKWADIAVLVPKPFPL